jgi:hypothetical protein
MCLESTGRSRSQVKKGTLLGLGIGTGVGVLLGALAEGDNTEDPGMAAAVLGLFGALIGTGIGAVISGRTQRLLIYETK